MTKPRLLDLFSGAGGAARGYQLAGFHVTGVDIHLQPRYAGDEFYQADAMTYPLDGFDAIHASPPCQAYSPLNARCGYTHTIDLVDPIRQRLLGSGVPWVIENVMGAPLVRSIRLCGGMFGLRTYRHRLFESNCLLMEPYHPPHIIKTSTTVTGNIGTYCGKEAMAITWMTGAELSQAIPPPYTEFIGRQLIEFIREGAA